LLQAFATKFISPENKAGLYNFTTEMEYDDSFQEAELLTVAYLETAQELLVLSQNDQHLQADLGNMQFYLKEMAQQKHIAPIQAALNTVLPLL
jgi:hypothetical protein